jgi:hypothetical protein
LLNASESTDPRTYVRSIIGMSGRYAVGVGS